MSIERTPNMIKSGEEEPLLKSMINEEEDKILIIKPGEVRDPCLSSKTGREGTHIKSNPGIVYPGFKLRLLVCILWVYFVYRLCYFDFDIETFIIIRVLYYRYRYNIDFICPCTGTY